MYQQPVIICHKETEVKWDDSFLTVSMRRAGADDMSNLYIILQKCQKICFSVPNSDWMKEVDQNGHKHAYDWSRNSGNKA